MTDSFKAYRVHETDAGFTRTIETRKTADLPDNDVLIEVAYSSLNYKDALSATGNKGVTKTYPHTPGIDASGTVIRSKDARFQAGDNVIVTSYDLGMNTDGGFAQRINVPADWVVPLPEGMSLKTAMMYGTAGFTAAMSVHALHAYGNLQNPLLVTGASGGVGSVAVALLAKLGHQVIASTGTQHAHDMLRSLGATSIIDRHDLSTENPRPLLKPAYGGAIDTVGGHTLSNIIKSLHPHSSVAACGLVGGAELPLMVYPFILRGVNLLGIDSQTCPMALRQELWQHLASDWAVDLSAVTTEITLDGLDDAINAILKGETLGRVVLKL